MPALSPLGPSSLFWSHPLTAHSSLPSTGSLAFHEQGPASLLSPHLDSPHHPIPAGPPGILQRQPVVLVLHVTLTLCLASPLPPRLSDQPIAVCLPVSSEMPPSQAPSPPVLPELTQGLKFLLGVKRVAEHARWRAPESRACPSSFVSL